MNATQPHEDKREKLYALAEIQAASVMATAEKYLTLAQLRERLQCSRSTAWKLIHEHNLPTVRVSGLVRIRERDLQAWLQRHTSGGEGEAAQ